MKTRRIHILVLIVLLFVILVPAAAVGACAPEIVSKAWSANDVGIGGDDEFVEYALPFTFPFFGRSIQSISVNTNGLVELLEAGESSYEGYDYGTHADGDHVGTMDAIFAANSDLISGIAIEGYSDRVDISWIGTTYSSGDLASNPMAFMVTVFSNGDIIWKFFDLDYSTYSDDLFSGVYARESDTEYEIPGGTTSMSGTGVYQAFKFSPSPAGISSIAWDSNDYSLPGYDDDYTGHSLPFTFPFFGREITSISYNTNGLIELQESGESCYECSDYDTHSDGDHIGNMDAIFAANDDLITGIIVHAYSDRVELLWGGCTYDDGYIECDAELIFKVILYQDGRVVWKFFSMDWGSSSGFMYSGLYDNEGDTEYEVPYPGGSSTMQGENIYKAYEYIPYGPKVIAISLKATVLTPVSQAVITFDDDVYNPAGNTDPDDVTNPDNYMLINPGVDGGFSTKSCDAGPQGDDVQLPTGPVTYDAGTFTATVTLNNGVPLPLGKFKLFICGTTSIYGSFGYPLEGGTDSIHEFTVVGTVAPETGFAPNQVADLPVQPAEMVYTNTAMMLSIPDLGIDLPIVGVPLLESGWDLSWLGTNAGWLEGTAYPTWSGNTVITAHVWDANGYPGIFANIKHLSYGTQITIHSGGYAYTYEVRENFQVYANNTNSYLGHEDYDWLTLVTCEGFSEWSDSYIYRRVVKAVLISVLPE